MLLPVLLEHVSDLSDHLNGPITHFILVIVHKFVKKWKDSATDALVTHLAEILSHEGNKGRELIQKSFLDVSVVVIRLLTKTLR